MIRKEVKKRLMGSEFTLGVIADSQEEAAIFLSMGVSEIKRIENLISEYKNNSATSKCNRAPVNTRFTVCNEVFQLIQRSMDISRLTHGCFDITASALKKLYSFSNNETQFPSKAKILNALDSVGYNKLKLCKDDLSVTKLQSNMHVSFNAIGKGYASDMVKKMWREKGVKGGFVNASGDLSVMGKREDNKPWNVAIAHPDNIREPLLQIPMYNQAVATSGDSEQFFIHKGVKYSHNINPLTGIPVTGLKSVSVISPSAELSDALATAVYVMGKEEGLAFVSHLPQTFAIIIDEKNELFLSKKLKYETINR